jgi:hypothetical protein
MSGPEELIVPEPFNVPATSLRNEPPAIEKVRPSRRWGAAVGELPAPDWVRMTSPFVSRTFRHVVQLALRALSVEVIVQRHGPAVDHGDLQMPLAARPASVEQAPRLVRDRSAAGEDRLKKPPVAVSSIVRGW